VALPEALLGNRWTDEIARHIFPLLVWCANHGQKITYGQLDVEVQRRGWGDHVFVSKYGYPAGAIGRALLETEKETGQKIPPLNALIVNAKTGVPGDGCDYYLSTYLDNRRRKKLSDDQRKSMAEETIEEKYQALLRAELKAEIKVPNGVAVFVTERRLPFDLQNLADLLSVRAISVRRVSK
jgi:hypothetical protein